MSSQLSARLREARVVLSDAQLEQYQAAVAKLVGAQAPSADDQLARLRMAFDLPVSAKAVERFDAALASAGLSLKARDWQLRRVLAACVLIERFGRGQGKRKRSSIRADSLAALAARSLSWSGVAPVHPDITSWAHFWVETVSQDLRARLSVPDRPSLQLDDPNADATVDAATHATQSLTRWRVQLQEYGEQFADWSDNLDPAHIAAHEEQLGLLWWLQSTHGAETAEEAVGAAASELAQRTGPIPGPPRADQLLARRLGHFRTSTVSTGTLGRLIRVPGGLASAADLCPMLSGEARLKSLTLPAPMAAQWLLSELLFVRLLGETS